MKSSGAGDLAHEFSKNIWSLVAVRPRACGVKSSGAGDLAHEFSKHIWSLAAV